MTFNENCACRAVPLPIAPPETSAIVWLARPKLVLIAWAFGSDGVGLGAQPGDGLVTGAETAKQIPVSGFAKLG